MSKQKNKRLYWSKKTGLSAVFVAV